jgi:hypothetical protein
MKGHKRTRKAPNCPMGGYHQVGRGQVVWGWYAMRQFERRCTRCGRTWRRFNVKGVE